MSGQPAVVAAEPGDGDPTYGPTPHGSPARSGRLVGALPAVAAGGVLGVTEVVIAVSFAALVFSGPLAVHLPAGVGLLLVGAAVVLVVVAASGSLPGTVGSVQDVSAALMAVTAAAVAARLPAEEMTTFLTVVLAIALATVLCGLLFLVLGSLRLGDLVRFVPYPVIAGFLAGTGWLLAVGGLEVLVGGPLGLDALGLVGDPVQLARWIPAIAFAVAVLLLGRRITHPLLLPGALVVAVGGFHAALLLGGWSLAEAEADGWLLGPLPQGALWQPWTWSALAGADWGTVAAQAGGIATLLLFATLGVLLNASGIELVADAEVDLDRELRVAGAANVLAGLGGGIAGYQALSLTVLAHRMRAARRLTGVVAAGVCVLALLVGVDLVARFPRLVVGALLLTVGLGLLVEWAVDTAWRLGRGEHIVVLLILAVMASWGLLQGVVVGVVIATALFVVAYSRVDVVRHALTGATLRSRVDRPPGERAALRALGDQLLILELQGFLFFGTANSLLERIRARAHDATEPPLRFLVLDLAHVSGVDSSAAMGLARVERLVRERGATLVVAGADERVRGVLERSGLLGSPVVRLAADLDHGVQWCEERLLADLPDGRREVPASLAEVLLAADRTLDTTHLAGYVDVVEVDAGQTLIHEGERSADVYLLARGRLTARLEGGGAAPVRLRELGPGAFVGEMSRYLDAGRTASIVALEPSRLERLSEGALEAMEREDPHLAAALHRVFARLLAERLADGAELIRRLHR